MALEWTQLIFTLIAAVGASIVTSIASRRVSSAQAEKLSAERREIDESLPSEIADKMINSAARLVALKDREAEVRQREIERLEAERVTSLEETKEIRLMLAAVTRDIAKLRSALLLLNNQLHSVGEIPIINVENLLSTMESVEKNWRD